MTQGWIGFLLNLAFWTATIFFNCAGACMAPVERRSPLWSTNFECDSQNGLQFLLCLASIQFQWLFLRKSIDFFLLLMKVDKYKNLVLRLMRCHCTLDFCFQINYSPIRSYWISFLKKLYASKLGEEGGTPLIFFFFSLLSFNLLEHILNVPKGVFVPDYELGFYLLNLWYKDYGSENQGPHCFEFERFGTIMRDWDSCV